MMETGNQKMKVVVPLPTQRNSLMKISNASHSGFSKGSKHSLEIHLKQSTQYTKLYNQRNITSILNL